MSRKFKNILVTTRLELNELSIADLDLIYALRSNPDIIKYTGISKYLSKDVAVSYIDKITAGIKSGETAMWTITRKSDSKQIGSICLFNFDDKNENNNIIKTREAEIGYDLLVEFWGNGYIPEAASALVSYAFAELGLSSIIAVLFLENSKSISVLKKLGFVYEEIRPDKDSSRLMAVYRLSK